MTTSRMMRRCCLAAAAGVLLATSGCAKEPHAAKLTTDAEVLEKMRADIAKGVEALSRDVEATAQIAGNNGLADDTTRAALAKLCADHRAFLFDCSTIDPKGIMVIVEPVSFRHMEGTNVRKHLISIDLTRTKEPVVSQVFTTSEKISAVVFEWPVFSRDGSWIGAVSVLISPEDFIGDLIKEETAPPIYAGWVAQLDGRLLFGPDPKQTGRNVFTDPYYRDMRELLALGRKVMAERTGKGSFRRPGAGQSDFIERLCFWDTVDFHNTQWRVILVKKI